MLIQEVTDLATDSTLADAQEIGAQLQSAMEDLYYAHRMSNPNPTVKQNIDLLQKSIRSFNQDIHLTFTTSWLTLLFSGKYANFNCLTVIRN